MQAVRDVNQFKFAMAVVAATPGMGAGQGQTGPPGLPMAEVSQVTYCHFCIVLRLTLSLLALFLSHL